MVCTLLVLHALILNFEVQELVWYSTVAVECSLHEFILYGDVLINFAVHLPCMFDLL